MDKVVATLRTLGILLALWVILAGVGLVAGVIPLSGLDQSHDVESPADAGAPAHADAGPTTERDAGAGDEAPDAGSPAAPVEPEQQTEELAPPLARWAVCASTPEPSLAVAQLFGDARPEVIVGCGDRWEVIALDASGVPARIAVLTAPPPPSSQRARTGPAAVGDVDGNGVPDLALPLANETAQGASRGGGLFWVPGDAFGGIREPVALAPIAAVDVAITPLDAQAGADIVAMNRANALAQLPSEAWVFAGGAAPSRRAAIGAGLGGTAVRVADLDRDGHADIVSLARDRVSLAFGDGQGAFPRTHAFELAGAREIAVGDLDADGGVDLAVLGEGLRWIRAGALDGMEPRAIDGAPANLRDLAIADTDADGKLDFIGWDHPRLIVLRQQGEVAFVSEVALTLAGPVGPRRQLVADLDGDGRSDDLVLLGTSAEDAPLELVVVPDAVGRGEVRAADEAMPIPDAPLTLRAALPAPG